LIFNFYIYVKLFPGDGGLMVVGDIMNRYSITPSYFMGILKSAGGSVGKIHIEVADVGGYLIPPI
jgi:hypothetical protein